MFYSDLSEQNFEKLSKIIHDTWGVKMPPSKKGMLQTRLAKRLRSLNFDTFDQYCQYLFSPEGARNEQIHLIDVVTTNKTDFFREPESFNYLVQKILPELVIDHGIGLRKKLMVWSAGCSTGEEPYTLAMVLSEFAHRCPGFAFDYSILATDISISVLEKAKAAIYKQELTEPIPPDMKRKYLLQSKDRSKKLARVVPELRAQVQFRCLNLMDEFKMREWMDIIFCRNVIIYFERDTQAELFLRFCEKLAPGGYLFLGHSESLNGLSLPLTPVVPTIYRKI